MATTVLNLLVVVGTVHAAWRYDSWCRGGEQVYRPLSNLEFPGADFDENMKTKTACENYCHRLLLTYEIDHEDSCCGLDEIHEFDASDSIARNSYYLCVLKKNAL